MPLEDQSGGSEMVEGYFTQADTAITTGFEPHIIEFYANLHQDSFGIEYNSGANTGGGANSYSVSMGFAIAAHTVDQVVTGYAMNSNGMDEHHSFAGDGEIAYLFYTQSGGSTINGRARAEVSAIRGDGFDVNWLSTITPNVYVLYRAHG